MNEGKYMEGNGETSKGRKEMKALEEKVDSERKLCCHSCSL